MPGGLLLHDQAGGFRLASVSEEDAVACNLLIIGLDGQERAGHIHEGILELLRGQLLLAAGALGDDEGRGGFAIDGEGARGHAFGQHRDLRGGNALSQVTHLSERLGVGDVVEVPQREVEMLEVVA